MSGQKRGFTLVELLVVIGIICLLLAIVFPVINKAQDQARELNCSSHMGKPLARMACLCCRP